MDLSDTVFEVDIEGVTYERTILPEYTVHFMGGGVLPGRTTKDLAMSDRGINLLLRNGNSRFYPWDRVDYIDTNWVSRR